MSRCWPLRSDPIVACSSICASGGWTVGSASPSVLTPSNLGGMMVMYKDNRGDVRINTKLGKAKETFEKERAMMIEIVHSPPG
jgi:hypothetical protein